MKRLSLWWVVALAGMSAGGAAAQAGFDDSASARLLMAARANDMPAVKRALADGASINARNRIGESALLGAVKRNDRELASLLIDAGADVDQPAVNG
ncbi:MAG: ankyrin repeat domain-containing protein, partial [Casimicrobiaceae bacterium]